MAPPGRIPDRLIAAHAGALRALAVALASDRHEAEEIEQETWMRAVAAPPPSLERFGGWLATVARGFASKRRRSRARRDTHERAYAAGREIVAACDAERGDTLRAVVEALLALDEPYRSTVWQRYFDELSTREIAARQRAPLATVESRLSRAHSKLRVEIERRLGTRGGGAQRALLALVGIDRTVPAALGGALTGAWIVSLKAKIVVAAAAALLAWWCWHDVDGTAPTAASATGAAVESQPVPAPIASPDAAMEPARAALGASVGRDSDAERLPELGTGPYEYELDFAPLDAHGRPLAATEVYLAPLGRPFARIGTTDWTGHLRVKWRAFAPALDALIAADRVGVARTPLRRVRLLAGALNQVTCATYPTHGMVVRTALIVMNGGESRMLALAADTYGSQDWQLDERGNAIFPDEWITPAEGRTPTVPQLSLEASMVTGFGLGRGGAGVSLELPGVTITAADSGTLPAALEVETLVLDVAGEPVANALASVSSSEGARSDGWTDADGRFRTDIYTGATEPIELLLAAGGLERPLVTTRVSASAGAPLSWRATLFAQRTLAGRLAGTADQPLAGWTLELLDSRSRNCVGLAVTDEQGRFRFGQAPVAPVDLVARHPEGHTRFVALAEVLPSEQDEALAPRIDPRRGRIRFELVDARGEPITDAQVRVVSAIDGRGARGERVELPDGDPRALWQTPELAAGEHEIEVGGPGRGWRRMGSYRLEPGEDLELGVLRWDSPEFVLRAPDGARVALSGTLETVSGGVRVRSVPFRSELPITLALEGEDWTLDGRLAQIAPGEDPSGELDFGPGGRLVLDPRVARERVLAPRASSEPSGEQR